MQNQWLLIVILFIISCDFTHRGVETLLIKGSDTEVNVVLSLAEAYMADHPQESIAVTGGGSGTGIAALLNRKTDLANSSRPLKDEEYARAQSLGLEIVGFVFAQDALAIITHPQNPVKSLSQSQISQIYQGQMEFWSELGGPEQEISLYGRQSNSGTFTYFREEVVRAEYSNQVKQMNGTAQIVEAVRQDPAGIGYVGLGYVVNKTGAVLEGVQVLSIETEKGIISPLDSRQITSGAYPIVRPLWQFLAMPITASAERFLQYEWTEKGQQIVSDNGYYPMGATYESMNQQTLRDAKK